MISFIPRVGKVQTGQSSGGFTAIIPNSNDQKTKELEIAIFITEME